MTETIIVIPCYNEAHRLDIEAFKTYSRSHPGTGFLLVDDGSTDETASMIASLCQSDPNAFSMLSLERNSGKAEAVRQGVLKAFGQSPEYVGFWDADLSTPLDQITSFVDALRADPDRVAIIGSRVRSLGRNIDRRMMRHYTGRVFATMAALVLGEGVYDTQCGAKLFRASDAVRGLFEDPFLSKWVFDVEILARLFRMLRHEGSTDVNRAVLELPLEQWRDVAGSKLNLTDAIRGFLDLMRINRRYPRGGPQG